MRFLRPLVWALALLVLGIVAVLILMPGPRSARRTDSASTGRRGSISDRNGRRLAFDDTLNSAVIRRYPAAETMSCMLGFKGVAGLEYSLDSLLIPRRSGLKRQPVGSDVFLTIDYDLQRAVFRLLRQALSEARAARAAVVIINAATGEVLALADCPGFDPLRARLYPPEAWRCLGVMQDFAPGPAFEIVPLAVRAQLDPAAVSAGRVDSGIPQFQPELFVRTCAALGFGQRTGIEIAAEAPGGMPGAERLADPELLAAAWTGLGCRVTLLQLAQGYAALAQNSRAAPFLLGRTRGPAGAGSEHRIRRLATGLTESAVRAVRERLRAGMQSGSGIPVIGLGGFALQPDSSQILVFAGYLPAERPRYALAVMLEQPLAGYATTGTPARLSRLLAEQLALIR
jgi:cell division protein FtsI/penicillin-binding protein 2